MLKMPEDTKKLLIIRGSGNPYQERWSYEAREVTISGKNSSNKFILRVTAEKKEGGYSLCVHHQEYLEEGGILFKPEEPIDLSDPKQIDNILKKKIRKTAEEYSKKNNLPLEDRTDS